MLSDSETPDSIEQQATDSDTPLVRLYCFFLFMFQSLFRLSDTALNALVTFLAMFLRSLSNRFPGIPKSFLEKFPSNLRLARKQIGHSNTFRRYVCCPSCRSNYNWNDCILTLSNGDVESKRCHFIQFPNHPQTHHRKPCDTILMKKVKLPNSKVTLYPKMIYTYKSIIDSLQEMLYRQDFLQKCEAWRSLPYQSGAYRDIYDGRIWKDFQNPDSVPFLSVSNNFAFQINVDWFNPFKHTQHSEGAIYISVLNLPRKERFLQENIILIGIIPGPKEPSLHINSFLRPLVDELKQLWVGVRLVNANQQNIIVRGALLCVGCDIPAARKVGGFVGHRATKGCSKCTLSFPTKNFGDKPDYSNYDRNSWELRTNDEHRAVSVQHLQCNTQTDQRKIEREYGVRYSVLLELPYYDAPRMCVIDPMHNLLLGTAKHTIEVWKQLSILDSKTFNNTAKC